MSARAQRILQRTAAVLVGAAVALALAEVGYRFTRSDGLSPTTNPAYVTHDATLGWSYRPGSRVRHRSSEFDVAITINAQGFRGKDWPTGVPDKKPRVLVLGDSFAFGWGVDDERCFSAILQQREPNWQVFNAGVSGYGTDQEELLLERLLPIVRPDVVVCVFCGNDLFECASSAVYGKLKPRYARRDGALSLFGVPVPQTTLERWSQLWCAIEKARFDRGFARRHADPAAEWPLVCDIFRLMKSKLGTIPLLIVSSEDRLAAFAREEGNIGHVDLRLVLGHAAGLVEYPLDGHWTPLAHQLIADHLGRELEELLAKHETLPAAQLPR